MLFLLFEFLKLVMSFFNFSGFQSPPRRPIIIPSPTSPFCTSPSQLQEVTLNEDVTFSNTMNLHSPGGSSRGRSVKEFEEQLANLKKENFNLKLRIYFLEERMGTNFDLNKENVVKRNIELMVETESLKKELQEKHDLLCQAVKAMELEDDEHKKTIQEKEDQLMQCQQEIEDLRLQLQDIKYEADGTASSHKSFGSDPSTYYSKSALPETHVIIKDLQDKVNLLEDELSQEKENGASLQLLLDQAEGIKSRHEALLKESEAKGEKIIALTEELQQVQTKASTLENEVRDLEQKLEESTTQVESLNEKILQKNKLIDEMLSQLNDVRRKYASCKIDLEREHKLVGRMKIMNDLKVTELEDENEKQKNKIRDLQGKLEAALLEVKKNQNLAVSKSPVHKLSASNTDVNSISASDTATSSRTPQKDALHVQIKSPTASSISSSTPPPSPCTVDIGYIQKIIEGGNENISMKRLMEQLQLLKDDYENQKKKIIKLKAEQMKACNIIKGMINSRTKYTQENTELKSKVDKLEQELENVVTKPTSPRVNGQDDSKNSHSKTLKVGLMATDPDHERTMAANSGDSNDLAEQYKTLCVELEEKIQVLVATMKEKDSQMAVLREQHDDLIKNLQQREDRIVDLEFEMLSSLQTKNPVKKSLFSEKTDAESEKDENFYIKQIDERDHEIERLTGEVSKLKSELTKRNGDLQGLVNKELWEKNRQIEKLENRHANALGTKDKQITELKNDLSNKQLQLKVLKHKISELGIDIDASTNSGDVGSYSKTRSDSEEIIALKAQIKSALEERKYFEDKVKELQQKADVSSNIDKVQIIEKLKLELECLQKEYEHSERIRLETNDMCSVLSSRLEDLAIFLDSLLKQKSVLGFLGSKENKKLREIIDHSLDLSRTFAVSILSNTEQSITNVSNISHVLNPIETDIHPSIDFSKADNDTSLSIIPESVTLTYRSHLYASSATNKRESDFNSGQVIHVLRKQIENLKSELQVRDTELCKLNDMIYQQKHEDSVKPIGKGIGDVTSDLKCEEVTANNLNTSTTLKYHSENQSESEAWSEPDRSVSKARIGIDANSSNSRSTSGKRSRLTCNLSSESTEDDVMQVIARTPSKKSLVERSHTITELQKQICEMKEKMVEEDTKVISLEESNFKLKQMLKDEQLNNEKNKSQLHNLELQLKETEEKLLIAEKTKADAELQMENVKQVVEKLTLEKQKLEMHMEGERKGIHEQINLLEAEKNEALKTAKELEKEVENARNQLNSAENKVSELQKTMNGLANTLHQEYKDDLMKKLKYAEEHFINKLKVTEEVANAEITTLKQKMKDMEAQYKQDYVEKIKLEEKTCELEFMITQNQVMKDMISTFEGKLTSLQAKEQEYNETLEEYQDKITMLRRDLDNTTLQYSEAVLEKTKLSSEKSILEQELNKVNYKENEMKQQVAEIQSELLNVKQNYRKQITLLQDQKLKLEVRISELESMNSELQNRLISLRSVPGDHIYSTSLPSASSAMYSVGNRNIPVNQLVNYKRQCSDNSGYMSEEQHVRDGKDGVFQYVQPLSMHPGVPVDLERHEANSSPDLGIESDHGRFSSLEAQLNIPRPLLQTLELTESMNNLLDAENNHMQHSTCDNEHCCKKSLEMANENSDLKKKLMRTRRALEETVTQLTLANQRKKQVEKTICKQIHKTSQVLRKAKANLDSGSETDLYRK